MVHAGRIAGLLVIAALQFYWYQQPAALSLKIFTAGFLGLCLASPVAGLYGLAALAPISSFVESLSSGTGLGGGPFLEQLVLGVVAGALYRWGDSTLRTRLGSPAAVVSLVALASAAAMFPAAAAATAPPGLENGPDTYLRLLLNRPDADYSPVWSPVFVGIMVAECAALGWAAERLIRRAPAAAPRLVAILLIGHAAASLLAIRQVVRIAIVNGGGIASLPETLMTVRVSMQMDVHATASALLLSGVAGAGLMAGSRSRRLPVAALLVAVGLGLWITGSRVALVLAGVIALLPLGIWAFRSPGRRIVTATATVIVVGAVVWLATLYPTSRYSAPSRSLQARMILAKAGLELSGSAPIFGIGIDRFYNASAAMVGPGFESISGYAKQNAHNNFLQVLAEQGLVGLAAMLWWLGTLIGGAWRAQRDAFDPFRGALLLGVSACVGTWLTGHPLLVREFGTVFWLYAGILAALTPPTSSRLVHRIARVVIAVLILSVPFRALMLRRAADLDHLGFGLTLWQHDDERRYRNAGAASAIYLRANERPVIVPMRRAPGNGPLIVELRQSGRVIKTLSLTDDTWRLVEIALRPRWNDFELVEITARPTDGSIPPEIMLRIGRAETR